MNDIYTLSNFTDLSGIIREPLKQTQRIKYTCFDASQNYLVFGATSGSLYLFNRNPYKFLHLISNKHGPMNLLLISPKEKYIAFTTTKGIICVYVINLSPNSAPQVINANIGEVSVNCLHWCLNEKQFYYGDRKGEVNLVSLSFFMGRSLLNISVHPILFLESPIVQISDFESLLLVSNYTKCILCNTEYEEFKQIGNRPRDGYYGACFSISQNESILASRIYCARPGSRFWEIDLEGNVLQTHQFKSALGCPPMKILKENDLININDENDINVSNDSINYPIQNLQFSKLQTILFDFIITFTENGFYIFDLRTSNLILWCNELQNITDCKILNNNEIILFTNFNSIYTIRFETLQSLAIDLIKTQKLLHCVNLLKTNLKYFAEKSKEQYDLLIVNELKDYLIKTNQYELLNDLSVIFDSLTQSEYEIIKTKRYENGIYVLENSFCDNLKYMKKPINDRQNIKDALLTVTGKFGKNIIKYKFNIFTDEEKNLVNDLIPNKRQIPFDEINQQYENDNNIVSNKHLILRKELILPKEHISEEEKTIRNLYIIFKSSKISNINFLDRYSKVFDRYDSREIIDLLNKLEKIMIENGDSEIEAKINSYEMYFNYLNFEIIWELDEISRDFIINGFILINTTDDIIKCSSCEFPLRFNNSCKFHDLGEILIKFLWSRNEQERCFEIIKKCPSIMDIICRYYIQENQFDKILSIIFNFGDIKLFEDAAKLFNLDIWKKCFEIFMNIQNGNFNCINCMNVNQIDYENSFFYTWNCFLNIALQTLNSLDLLDLLIIYSNQISNNDIDRDFFINCLLKK